jgi:hypothetical protein
VENNQLIIDMLYFIVYAGLGTAGAYFGTSFTIQAKRLASETVAPALRNVFNAGGWVAQRIGERRAASLDEAGEVAADAVEKWAENA